MKDELKYVVPIVFGVIVFNIALAFVRAWQGL